MILLLYVVQRRLPVGSAYFNPERSFALHRLPDSHYAIVAFGKEASTILIVTSTGAFHKLRFDPEKGGPCEQLVYRQWKPSEEEEEEGVPTWE